MVNRRGANDRASIHRMKQLLGHLPKALNLEILERSWPLVVQIRCAGPVHPGAAIEDCCRLDQRPPARGVVRTFGGRAASLACRRVRDSHSEIASQSSVPTDQVPWASWASSGRCSGAGAPL